MTRIHVLFWLAVAIACLAAAVMLPRPSFAAERCVRYDIFARALETNGFTVHPPLILDGFESERLMIVERDGEVLASPVIRGCVTARRDLPWQAAGTGLAPLTVIREE